jgi:hypothetical protein
VASHLGSKGRAQKKWVVDADIKGAFDNIAGRDTLFREARRMVIEMYGLDETPLGLAEADRLLAEARVHLLRKLRDQAERDTSDSEIVAASWEESAAQLVDYSLPEERRRIGELLASFPTCVETKTIELLAALGQIWRAETPACEDTAAGRGHAARSAPPSTSTHGMLKGPLDDH